MIDNTSLNRLTTQNIDIDRNLVGPISHYNGIIFEDMQALQADTEGALAIGGDGLFGSTGHSYDIGGATADVHDGDYVYMGTYVNEGNYPTLLFGGNLAQASKEVRIHGSKILMKLSKKEAYEAGAVKFSMSTVSYGEDSMITAFFSDAKEKVEGLGKTLLKCNDKVITGAQLKAFNQEDITDFVNSEVGTSFSILSVTIEQEDMTMIGEISFPKELDDYDIVAINCLSEEIIFSGGAILFDGSTVDTSLPRKYDGNKYVKSLAEKIIWNFPQATTVTVDGYGVTGSVLAPNATIVGSGGSINGMLMANELVQTGGMELHAFSIAKAEGIWELVENPQEPKYGSVALEKVDEENSTVKLEGAVFSLYMWQEDSWSEISTGLTTDKNGRLEINELEIGQYRLVETAAPNGYELDPENETLFTITVDREGVILPLETLTVTNVPAEEVGGSSELARLEIYKQDEEDSGLPLENAVFDLYRKEDGEWEIHTSGLVSGEQGEIVLEKLALGEYRLDEISPPQGYRINEVNETYFKVEQDEETQEVISLEPIVITNKAITGGVEFRKVDVENDEVFLEGAVFSLYKKESEEWAEYGTGYVTDSQGRLQIDSLKLGEYKLVETAAPEGYVLVLGNETLFTISDDGEGAVVQLEPITVYNQQEEEAPVYGSVTFVKVDAEDGEKRLEDAIFTLYVWQNERWVEHTLGLSTDENGRLEIGDLEPGEYRLVEIAAPEGYVLDPGNEALFTIALDSKGEIIPLADITLYNTREETAVAPALARLEVHKRDEDDNEIPLQNAVFALHLQYGEDWQEHIVDLITDENGMVLIEELEPGEYKIVEVTPPEGYQLNEINETLFSVLLQEENQGIIELSPIIITNRAAMGTVEFLKVDSQNPEIVLEGAVFTLYKWDGSEWDVYGTELTTNDEGRLQIENLASGEYRLVEVTPPEGYVLEEGNETFFTLSADTSGAIIPLETITLYNTPEEAESQYGQVAFEKVDALNPGMRLEGAIFTLYVRQEGQWTEHTIGLSTDENGRLEIEDLEPGEYRLVEIIAPEGYVLEEGNEVGFTIALNSAGNILPLETITLYNTPEEEVLEPVNGRVELLKVDSCNHSLVLAGAAFDLYFYVDGEWRLIRHSLITNSEGKLYGEDLEPGAYKFIEFEAPEGYTFNPEYEWHFRIPKSDESTPVVYLTAENRAAGAEEPGDCVCVCRPCQPNPCRTRCWSERQNIYNGQWNLGRMVLNMPKGIAEVYVMDVEDATALLPGAEFTLCRKNQNGWSELLKEAVTNEHGILVLEDLEPGEYRLVQTGAPEGYHVEPYNEILFSISFDFETGALDHLVVEVFNKSLCGGRGCPTQSGVELYPRSRYFEGRYLNHITGN